MPAKVIPVEKTEEEGIPRYTKVMFHGCPHKFQDEIYGEHQRVFNRTKFGWRCTICGGLAT